jgi:hypothetical protein
MPTTKEATMRENLEFMTRYVQHIRGDEDEDEEEECFTSG